jgi:hypothetical protein
MRTDHTALIADMRALSAVDFTAAADLLELHDRTSLNLHEAPGLLAFVEDRLKSLHGVPIKVRPNFV